MIAVLGATGTVGGKIADILIKSGRKVRLVARSAEDLRRLVSRKAGAMAGDAQDPEFLIQAFRGADAVFTLIPPNGKAGNYLAYADRIGESIAHALKTAGVEHVVNLSSIGAELPGGTGPIVGLHRQEERLNKIPGLNVIHVRSAFFMENLFMNIDVIREQGVNRGAIRGDMKIPMIATRDVAAFSARRLVGRDFAGSSVKYLLGGRDVSPDEAAMSIGIRIGRPNLRYVTVPYPEAERDLQVSGLSEDVSRLCIEMIRALNEGRIAAKRSPDTTTPTSFEEFCDQVFVPLFMRKKAA